MFHPLPLFVGLRYVRSRSDKFFVSFITWVSMLGVAVGVAALIVILSVMNGLEGELRDRLLALTAPVHVLAPADAPRPDWAALEKSLQAVPGVRSATAYAELQVLAVRQPEMLPVTLRGLDTTRAEAQADLKDILTEGSLTALASDPSGTVVGRIVADRLGLTVGDTLYLLAPVIDDSGIPDARLRSLTVRGIFEAGIQDHDGTLIFAPLPTVQAMGSRISGEEGLRLQVADVLAAPQVASRVAAVVGPGLTVRDWTQDHASYFRAIRIEKTMMALILLLIVGVAVFNIVAMLVMVVSDKRTDIAILRTFGASPRRVMGIFATQGLSIGWLGVFTGVMGGVLLAANAGRIVAFLEGLFRFQVMDSDVFYITRIPSQLHWQDVTLVAVLALLLTVMSTVYPALRAARTSPAEALRYE